MKNFHLFVTIPVNNEFDQENVETIFNTLFHNYKCREYSYGYGIKRGCIHEMRYRIFHNDKIILWKIKKLIDKYEFVGMKSEWIGKRRNTHCIDD